jgi:hypothetical protein
MASLKKYDRIWWFNNCNFTDNYECIILSDFDLLNDEISSISLSDRHYNTYLGYMVRMDSIYLSKRDALNALSCQLKKILDRGDDY